MEPKIKRQIYFVLLSILPEAILDAMLIPLFPFIVSELLDKNSNDVGYFTGVFSSAFYAPLFLMNIVWGWLSDKMGRKVRSNLLLYKRFKASVLI